MPRTFTPLLLFAGALVLSLCGAIACKGIQLDLNNPKDVKRLYRMRCSSCHSLYGPGELYADMWSDVLDEYGPRSGLTKRERAALQPWLEAQGKR